MEFEGLPMTGLHLTYPGVIKLQKLIHVYPKNK